MKRILFIVAMVCALCIFSSVSNAEAKGIKVVAGTEMIADVVRDLTGGTAEILSLVPAASCPGHHDVRAADIAFIKKADVIILHAWQQNQKHISDAVAAAEPAASPQYIQPSGAWLIPANQMDGSGAIYGILTKTPGTDFKTLSLQFNSRLIRVIKIAEQAQKKLAPYKDVSVMASAMQADFAASLGMKVVARYGRAEDMAPGNLASLVKQGQEAEVQVIIDNLQSGSEAGLPLSGELGTEHIAFSNFPMFIPEVPTFEALYTYNCELLREALEKGMKK